MGTHVLGIKDMAGLCKPYAAYALVKALRDEIDIPSTSTRTTTAGVQSGSILRASDAGVDIADAGPSRR
jgi:pyruvate carboxylase